MRKLSQLVRVAAVSTLAIGITAAVVPLASAAAAHPAAGRASAGGRAGAAGPSVNRTGYITITGGVKLAYDLTLPSAASRFPVARGPAARPDPPAPRPVKVPVTRR